MSNAIITHRRTPHRRRDRVCVIGNIQAGLKPSTVRKFSVTFHFNSPPSALLHVHTLVQIHTHKSTLLYTQFLLLVFFSTPTRCALRTHTQQKKEELKTFFLNHYFSPRATEHAENARNTSEQHDCFSKTDSRSPSSIVGPPSRIFSLSPERESRLSVLSLSGNFGKPLSVYLCQLFVFAARRALCATIVCVPPWSFVVSGVIV